MASNNGPPTGTDKSTSSSRKPFDSKFTVVIGGGGNAAQVAAALFAVRYDVYAVSFYENEAARWKAALGSDEFELTLDTGVKLHSKPKDITSDPAVTRNADIIVLAVPSFAHGEYFEKMAPFMKPGTIVATMPARSGGDILFASKLKTKASSMVFVGFETLPWACKFTEWGRKAHILGTKGTVLAAVTPQSAARKALAAIQGLMGVVPWIQESPNNLGISLRNPGMVIHPGVMYGKWGNWDRKPLKEKPLFYQGVDKRQEEVLVGISNEVQAIRAKMEKLVPGLDMSDAVTLKDWYMEAYAGQMSDTSTLGSCMKTVAGYQGLKHPMVEVHGGYAPDTKYRYLTEDVPTGLCFVKGLAEIIGVKTPMVDEVLTWSQKEIGYDLLHNGRMVGKDLSKTRAPQGMGITTVAQFLSAAKIEPVKKKKESFMKRLAALCC